MRIQSEEERRFAQATLKEVMSKLEEALRLARKQESSSDREHCCAGADA